MQAASAWRAAWTPPDARPPWAWCEQHVVVDNTSPMPGPWRSDNSPWARDVMEVFADNRVQDIAVMCAAQSSKTQTVMGLLCWAIAEDPGPAMLVMAAKDESETFLRDRLLPTLQLCDPTREKLRDARKLELRFAGMTLHLTGAGAPSKLQSKPIRWLLLDEVRNYPPGAMEMVLKRTRAFWNSRRVIVSTPGAENDAVHRAFLAGDQRVYHVPCPACVHFQPLKFEQLRYDTNEITKPNGVWNLDALAETLRFECSACGHGIRDTEDERKALARDGKFVAQNPAAPKHRVSFGWNALLPPWVRWRGIVEEFLAAQAAARGGSLEPLRTFVTETLGEPWRDEIGEIEDYGFLDARRAPYKFGEAWPDERVRFIAADKQQAGGEHYWYVVRAFGPVGRSRLVAYGRVNSTRELEELRQTHAVKIENAIIDSGYRAAEVYRFCQSSGWKATKGDEQESFRVTNRATGQTARQIFERVFVDPAYGSALQGRVKPIPLFRWSNPSVKDLLAEHMRGLAGEWTLPEEIGRDYLLHMTADQRTEIKDAMGRSRWKWKQVRKENHLKDCEEMILVGAVASKAIATRQAGDDPVTSDPPDNVTA